MNTTKNISQCHKYYFFMYSFLDMHILKFLKDL